MPGFYSLLLILEGTTLYQIQEWQTVPSPCKNMIIQDTKEEVFLGNLHVSLNHELDLLCSQMKVFWEPPIGETDHFLETGLETHPYPCVFSQGHSIMYVHGTILGWLNLGDTFLLILWKLRVRKNIKTFSHFQLLTFDIVTLGYDTVTVDYDS